MICLAHAGLRGLSSFTRATLSDVRGPARSSPSHANVVAVFAILLLSPPSATDWSFPCGLSPRRQQLTGAFRVG